MTEEAADELSDGTQPGTTERSLDKLRQMLTDRGWRLSAISTRYETWWHPDAPEETVAVPTDRQAGDFASLYDRTVRRLIPDPTRTPGPSMSTEELLAMGVGELNGPADTTQAYWVDLAILVEAATPEEAVHEFVEGVVQGNLRGWAYGVRDDAGVIVGVFDGFGSPIRREDLASPEEGSAEEVGETTGGDAEDDDEHLLSLATRLNQAQQD